MVSKIFVLGRTGSGKSTTVRLLTEEVRTLGWTIKTFNDYPYLREMYLQDDGKRFRPTAYDGFEVLDLSVYDEAFLRLKENVQQYQPTKTNTLIIIEFTSNNYFQTLKLFGNEFLQDARYLFLLADLPTCLARVNRRATHPKCSDDYYVVESVLLEHYPSPYMPPTISKEHVTFIPNMGSMEQLRTDIRQVPGIIIKQEQHNLHRDLLPVG